MTSLWPHLFDEEVGVLALLSGIRPEPGSKKIESTRQAYFPWPATHDQARAWIEREVAQGRETYHCAHLLTGNRRVKGNAAPVLALWADADGAKATEGPFEPTVIVESSPGREQLYCRLGKAVEPEVAEALNRRWAVAIGADRSGYDLTQLLRPPGTPNFKYPDAPLVRILELTDERHDPDELDRILPPLAQGVLRATRSGRPESVGSEADLSRLTRRMREVVRCGNRGEYPSRSEADLAVCLAMFGAGYGEAEVWAVMTHPAYGISEKFFEKGRYGEQYLGLTIGKARAIAVHTRVKRRELVSITPPRAGVGTPRKVRIGLG